MIGVNFPMFTSLSIFWRVQFSISAASIVLTRFAATTCLISLILSMGPPTPSIMQKIQHNDTTGQPRMPFHIPEIRRRQPKNEYKHHTPVNKLAFFIRCHYNMIKWLGRFYRRPVGFGVSASYALRAGSAFSVSWCFPSTTYVVCNR